jgi:hypothetical protein
VDLCDEGEAEQEGEEMRPPARKAVRGSVEDEEREIQAG